LGDPVALISSANLITGAAACDRIRAETEPVLKIENL
jgi:hypothetical protein